MQDDISRLRREYAERSSRLAGTDRYSKFNPSYLFGSQQLQRAVARALFQYGFQQLSSHSILEVGCGGGGVLVDFLSLGANPALLHGIDLLHDRLLDARQRLPAHLANADGQRLPYPAQTFDMVLQFTAFSSILDESIKLEMAAEMIRVLKPTGLILWYDFWINPTNSQTRGIRPSEIRRLYPSCSYHFFKVSLAPPIARRVVPVSWMLAFLLEKLKILNAHYLAVIRPHDTSCRKRAV